MVDEILEQFMTLTRERGYNILPISEEHQQHLDEVLRRNNIDPDLYPIRICGAEAAPVLNIYSEHGATLPQALVELETLAREAIGVNSEIRLKIEAQQLPLGERLMKKAAQIPSGGFVQGETFEGANIIITFAKPPSQ